MGYKISGTEDTYLGHGLFPEWDVVRSQCDSVDDGVGVALQDDAAVANLVHGQHDDVEVLEQGPLLHVLPQDERDGVENAVQNGHQEKLQAKRGSIVIDVIFDPILK